MLRLIMETHTKMKCYEIKDILTDKISKYPQIYIQFLHSYKAP